MAVRSPMSTERSVQGWFLAVLPARRGIGPPRCSKRRSASGASSIEWTSAVHCFVGRPAARNWGRGQVGSRSVRWTRSTRAIAGWEPLPQEDLAGEVADLPRGRQLRFAPGRAAPLARRRRRPGAHQQAVGPAKLPSQPWEVNRGWMLAASLDMWVRLRCLAGLGHGSCRCGCVVSCVWSGGRRDVCRHEYGHRDHERL